MNLSSEIFYPEVIGSFQHPDGFRVGLFGLLAFAYPRVSPLEASLQVYHQCLKDITGTMASRLLCKISSQVSLSAFLGAICPYPER